MRLLKSEPLFDHPAYSLTNPNRARSLLGAMVTNSSVFHQQDGAGYAFAAQKILATGCNQPAGGSPTRQSFRALAQTGRATGAVNEVTGGKHAHQ